jgi:hypothetical protein
MRKIKIFVILCLLYGVCACQKEEKIDYSFLEGFYQGNSWLNNVANYCRGNNLKLNVSNGNEVFMYAECTSQGILSKFEGYYIGPSRVDSATFKSNGIIYKAKVTYSIVDGKTNKEVGYFRKDESQPPSGSWWWFQATLLVSTQKDSLFNYAGLFIIP